MKALTKVSGLVVVALLLAGTAQAAMYNYTGSAYDIPDGSVMGVYSHINVGGEQNSLSHIAVTLDVSGGYNGDLYAYLSYGGALVPLLNRVGVGSVPATTTAFGYGDSVLHLVLTDLGANGDIHLYQQASGYAGLIADGASTWTPDGRNIRPDVSTPAQFDAAASSRLAFDTTFGGMNPNGTWTLYFADVSGGGGTSRLNDWSLDITAVPEPVNAALGVFAAVFLIVILARSRPVRDWLHRRYMAAVDWINAV
jgi:subtilisin-like proprotein convertase family protein